MQITLLLLSIIKVSNKIFTAHRVVCRVGSGFWWYQVYRIDDQKVTLQPPFQPAYRDIQKKKKKPFLPLKCVAMEAMEAIKAFRTTEQIFDLCYSYGKLKSRRFHRRLDKHWLPQARGRQ